MRLDFVRFVDICGTAALFCSFMHSFYEGQVTDRKKDQKTKDYTEEITSDYEPLFVV